MTAVLVGSVVVYDAADQPVRQLSGSLRQVLLNISQTDTIRQLPTPLEDLSSAPAPGALPALTKSDLEIP